MSIDAIIPGQKKEQGRISNNLPDNRKSTIVTIKLYFNAIKRKGLSLLCHKINTLIQQGYDKTSAIARPKKFGNIAKQRLLKAFKHRFLIVCFSMAPVCFLSALQHNSKKVVIDSFFNQITTGNFENAWDLAKSQNDQLLILCTKHFYYSGDINQEQVILQPDIKSKLPENVQIIIKSFINGKMDQNYNLDNLSAYKHYYNALQLSEKINNATLTKQALLLILSIYEKEIFYGNKQHLVYLDKLKNMDKSKGEIFLFYFYRLVFITKTIYEVEPEYNNVFKAFDSIYDTVASNKYFSVIYLSEKGLKERIDNNIKASIGFFEDALQNCSNKPYFKSKRCALHLNIGDLYLSLNAIKKADYHFKASKKNFISGQLKYDLFYYHRSITEYYKKINKPDSAFYHLNTSVELEYDLQYKSNSLEISQLSKRYQTVEKENQILIEQRQKNKNKNIAFGLSGLLLFAGVTFTLIQKNTKRKQKLAEKEKDLETQKLTTVLKDQELTAIDAMIAGQEKERQRIANDLHDDLGGLMATVKLHFNATKNNDSPALFDKTNALIDEAYNKVRTVAHAKNAGVIAKQGLLQAVKHMAAKVSTANTIQIDVMDHGLDYRLENSLELTIFRIIQELIANTIKHAQATEATIHLTNHEDNLNIMVEDNGIGFKPKQNTKTNAGMGLSSIDKRISHLNGKLTIESDNNSGTTVIIDIPL